MNLPLGFLKKLKNCFQLDRKKLRVNNPKPVMGLTHRNQMNQIIVSAVLVVMVSSVYLLDFVNRGSGRGENKTPPPKTQTLEYGKFAEAPTEDKSPKRGEGRRE